MIFPSKIGVKLSIEFKLSHWVDPSPKSSPVDTGLFFVRVGRRFSKRAAKVESGQFPCKQFPLRVNQGYPHNDRLQLLFNQLQLLHGILFAVIKSMTQLDLFGYASLSVAEKQRAFENIRSEYYWLRNLRKWKPNEARRRQIYRKIEGEKKRLREAGVLKSEILLFLNCCRDRCKLGKECPFCRPKYGGKFR